jgi:hypothetical protein
MGAFSEKGLQALNQAWVTSEQKKFEAERMAGICEAQRDQYGLAEAYQQYSDAEQAQVNLYKSYQMAEQRAAQQQSVPQPINEGEKIQRDVWEQIKVQDRPDAEAWNRYLTHRWRQGQAVANGARPEDMAVDHVPGRTKSRIGYKW